MFPPPSDQTIHDAVVAPLKAAEAGRLPLVSFEDHLLRRFGGAELVRLAAGETFQVRRVKADEVWILLDGQSQLLLEDERPSSPTSGAIQTAGSNGPMRILLPFGVRLTVRPVEVTTLVRIMTHSEREDPPMAEGA